MTSDRRRVIAGIVGNVLEWYDFAVYGFFAATIGKQFFPSDDPSTSLIAAFGAFAAGFLMRPFGSVLFGHIGDRLGRDKALLLSVAMMAVPTFMIGFLPTYETIGLAAPILLVLLRMAQGFSVGGEYTTSIVYLVEHAPDNRRGIAGSWALWGVILGILIGSGLGALLNNVLGPAQIEAWGWRIPFLLGVSIGIVGFYFRRSMGATAAMKDTPPEAPTLVAFRVYSSTMAKVLGIAVFNGVSFYLAFIYVASWLKTVSQDLTAANALEINSISMVLMLIVVPLAAMASDRIGRKPVMLAGMVGTILLAYPMFVLMHHDNYALALVGQLVLSFLIGLYFGTFPATIVEVVPPEVRVSVLSIGYNTCLALFGGTAPIVAAYLVRRTADDYAPAFYLIFAAVVTTAVILAVKEMAGRDLKNWSPDG